MLRAWWPISALVACSAQAPQVVPFGKKGEIHICSDTIIRVTHRPTEQPVSRETLIARTQWPHVDGVKVTSDRDLTIVETSKLFVKLSTAKGSVTFEDKATGRVVLQELETTFMPSKDMGQDVFQVEQSWAETSPSEGLFGGGSYQNGIVNFKNAPVELIQFNTEAVVPFFTSTEGYGVLWDNYAWTYLNPPTEAIIPPGSSSSGTVSFTPQTTGDHFFFVGKAFPQSGDKPAFGHGMKKYIKVTLSGPDGEQIDVQNWAGLSNMPNSLTGRAPGLKEGVTYSVQYSWNANDLGLFVQGPEYGKTVLRSFIGEIVDYYFVYGETFDGSIAGYRHITGAAPLYGKWVYGFWQCKEHYATQDGLLEAAHGFRNRSIPVDAFVQDWHYWGDMGWGPQWDPKVYPDPAAMVAELRSIDIHFMVSVWSKFDKSTSFWKQMNSSGWILGDSDYYDPFDADARDLYYKFSKDAMFSIGVDSLWQDATEPEGLVNADTECALGSGNAYMNAYSLETTRAIADGLRSDYGDAQGARVFTLTRSSFAAQQTTGAALWTGDISGTWDSLRRQISSAVNYQMSGIPYWAQDIGGFFRPKSQYHNRGYHELLVRWFQFGVFTPIFRVHGGGTNTELWNFGDDVMNIINSSTVSLRYRLLPYTYSGFTRVEEDGYTMLRGLPMDFPEDAATYTIGDEFMYGDAFLVTPIYHAGGNRSVYFPAGHWIDFHSGEQVAAGSRNVTFALEHAPAFVKAGSIVPLGPKMQHSAERPADPIELRVYGGGDASFTLFEDDGTSTAYQKGEKATITFAWNEASQELSIKDRHGSFDSMLQTRTFNVVFVKPGHGVGVEETVSPDKVVTYVGKAITVKTSPEALMV